MTRVLVVWEDTYFQPLDDILNRVVKKLAPRIEVSRPTVLHHTARSNTAFERYVQTTWPIASARGLPMNPGAIDHVVCVVDADKLSDLLRQQVPRPPNAASDVTAWHGAAERFWNSHLRSKCPPDGPAVASVHGVVLRWSKESVLLAGYDQASFAQHLDCDMAAPEIEQFLKECNPAPSEVDGDGFANSFRNPMQCLRALRKAARLPELPKNSPQFDDALRKLGRESLGTLCERTPDISRVAELVWKLHTVSLRRRCVKKRARLDTLGRGRARCRRGRCAEYADCGAGAHACRGRSGHGRRAHSSVAGAWPGTPGSALIASALIALAPIGQCVEWLRR